MNCVGILFVHDIDEKLFAAVAALNQPKFLKKLQNFACCKIGCCFRFQEVVCTTIFILFVVIFGQLVVLSGDPQYAITNSYAYSDSMNTDGTYNFL